MSDDRVYADHVVLVSTANMLKRDIVVTSSDEDKQRKIKGSNKPHGINKGMQSDK
jgi:hypothetical protein